MEKLYSVDELTESIISDYHLSMKVDNAKAAYKAKIYRTLHDLNMWDKAITKPNGKSKTKYFTENQKQQLLASPKLYDYVRENSESEEIKNSKRYKDVQAEIEIRRNDRIAYLNSLGVDEGYNDNAPFVSQKDLRNTMNTIMLTAIFEQFFTPINRDLLLNDLYATLYSDDLELDAANIEAEQRLEHPEGNYYKKKKHN